MFFHSACIRFSSLEALSHSWLSFNWMASCTNSFFFFRLVSRSSSSFLKNTLLLLKKPLKAVQNFLFTSFDLLRGSPPTVSHFFCRSRTSFVFWFHSLILSEVNDTYTATSSQS